MQLNDELKIYRGEDYKINDSLVIHQPTLGEICDFGENIYFSAIHTLTATPSDMKYQLFLGGIDWNELSDFELFLRNHRTFSPDRTGLIFGDLNIAEFELYRNKENDTLCLYDEDTGAVIDPSVYELMVSYLRRAHGLKKNEERAMTETTNRVLLDEAKEFFEEYKDKDSVSFLKPLISTMINFPGFSYKHNDVWDMKIAAFMDSVHRIQRIKNADLLLQSGYSGFGVDLKKINKNELNYFYEPDA